MDGLIIQRDRGKKVIWALVVLAALGTLLLLIGSRYGLYLPCIFHEVTGLYCPGCGISHMFVSLAHLDFVAAWGYNPAALIALPLLTYFIIQMIRIYVKVDAGLWKRWHNIVLYLLIGYFLLFGILRNLETFQWMAP